MTCSSGQVCSQNSCQTGCGAGETQCSDGACVPTAGGDALHCGGCNACPAGAACNAGVCACAVAGPDDVRQRVRRHDDQRRQLRRLQPPCNGTCTNGVCATTSGTAGRGCAAPAGRAARRRPCTPLARDPAPALAAVGRAVGHRGQGSARPVDARPSLSNRGGEAAYAFFSDATLGVDPDFQFALYQSTQNDVLPAIASKITTLRALHAARPRRRSGPARMTFAQSLGAKGFPPPARRGRGHQPDERLRRRAR